jgi:hypothetical protein
MSDHAFPDALPPQYRLHWYVLERVLGQGGFGITYLARDTNLDQLVAIKEYLPLEVAARRSDTTVRPRTDDQTDRYRWGLDRFIREARTLARFDHPNIVRVHSVFEFNNTAYMVMRFEEGENFAALLERRRTLPEADLMRVLLPVLDGLELVHNAGFIHRDIKPDNIHIRAAGSSVLLDFGSARASLGQARTVTILVAPGYAPFEQYYASGEDQGPWTDLYGLGATCYRAIAGIPPLDAIARSKGVLGSAREMLVPARTIGAGRYSTRLLKAIDHALEFAEKERPQTIAEWRLELTTDGPAAPPPAARAVAPGRPAPAVTPAPQAGAIGATPGERPAQLAPAKTSFMRVAAISTVLTAVAVIGGGIGAYMMNRGSQQPQTLPSASAPAIDAAKTALARAAAEKDAIEKVAAAKAAVEKEAAETIAATKAAAERESMEKAAAAKAATEKEAADKAAAEKIVRARAAMEKAAQAKAAAEKIATLQAEAEKAAQTRAAAEKEAEEKAAAVKAASAPPQDDKGAFAFYQGLAHRGDAIAALRLGELYEAGRGAAQNNIWACSWYALAERRGAAGARLKKDAVTKNLQPREVRQCNHWAERQAQARN